MTFRLKVLLFMLPLLLPIGSAGSAVGSGATEQAGAAVPHAPQVRASTVERDSCAEAWR